MLGGAGRCGASLAVSLMLSQTTEEIHSHTFVPTGQPGTQTPEQSAPLSRVLGRHTCPRAAIAGRTHSYLG